MRVYVDGGEPRRRIRVLKPKHSTNYLILKMSNGDEYHVGEVEDTGILEVTSIASVLQVNPRASNHVWIHVEHDMAWTSRPKLDRT